MEQKIRLLKKGEQIGAPNAKNRAMHDKALEAEHIDVAVQI